MTAPCLAAERLTVTVGPSGPAVVDAVSFSVPPGGKLALVGESGSGKTMAARAVLGLLPPPLGIAAGSRIDFCGRDLAALPEAGLRGVRGGEIGMVFQEPMVSLNPAITVGEQMAEGLRLHRRLSAAEIRDRCLAMLERIRIANPAACLRSYPHEFSGGMRQRIMLASVMLLKPKLLIADEPTTALDTLVQREVLDAMSALTEEEGTALLLISHDLGMVAHYVHDVAVMRLGRIVEAGPARSVLTAPRDAYTKSLVDALPQRRPARRAGAFGEAVAELRGVEVTYPGRRRLFGAAPAKQAVRGVDLSVRRGEIVALVGGSGSGKTTLGRAVVGLTPLSGGEIRLFGRNVDWRAASGRTLRGDVQMVFQDPFSSLDPRQSVGSIVEEPLRLDRGLSPAERRRRAAETLEEVGLGADFSPRLPHQLSGGQRQRVAIARAMVRRPAFIVADEPVSALDMTVQKQILALIRSLQERRGFACLFISHDLGAVEEVADRVAVMNDGRIVEEGSRDAVYDAPRDAYTRALLAASMRLARHAETAAS
ncbi:MAG: dipeptide ABC transporter ATP-binding protein [Pikeienuella sp.]|uniref:dipeptide ABC transporter ATP-binding protein n=1 Tax=Pikeienuella sp. TaxID=2831957 RepID=UPI00391A1FF3